MGGDTGIFNVSRGRLGILISLRRGDVFPSFDVTVPRFRRLRRGSVLYCAVPRGDLGGFCLEKSGGRWYVGEREERI